MRRLLIALTALVARCEEPQAPAAPPAPISLTMEARVSFVHGAVVETPGPATFYDLRRCGEAENDDDMERDDRCLDDYDASSLFASTNRTFVGWHVGFLRNGAAPIVRRTVPGFDWATLLTTHGGDAVGLLLLDVESMDCDLLLRFPFDDVRPDVVLSLIHI